MTNTKNQITVLVVLTFALLCARPELASVIAFVSSCLLFAFHESLSAKDGRDLLTLRQEFEAKVGLLSDKVDRLLIRGKG